MGRLARPLQRYGRIAHWRGYHVLLAGLAPEGPAARVLTWGDTLQEFEPDETGLLLGVPDGTAAGPNDLSRYARVVELTRQSGDLGGRADTDNLGGYRARP